MLPYDIATSGTILISTPKNYLPHAGGATRSFNSLIIYLSLSSYINYCWPAVEDYPNMTIQVHLSTSGAGPSSAAASSFAIPAIDTEDTLRQVVTRLRTAKRIVVVSGASCLF